MRLAAARLQPYALPLRAAWRTAAGALVERRGWLLRLASVDGLHGHGDCAPLPASGTEDAARAEAALAALLRGIVGRTVSEALAALPPAPGDAPAARCAVECALLDLAAQAAGHPLAEALRGAPAARSVAVNAALGALIDVDAATLRAAVAQGFTVLKLKVGTAPPGQEIARLRTLAAALPAGVRLRLDANRAWPASVAAEFIAACGDLPLDMLEEPLADPRADALADLQAAAAFPLALDESAPCRPDDPFFAAPPVRRLVLKPPRLGGLRPALALARRAAGAGLACVVTGSIDSACGLLAAAHLAAALATDTPAPRDGRRAAGQELAHGLATADWLAADLGQAPRARDGRLHLPAGPGLGFWPDT